MNRQKNLPSKLSQARKNHYHHHQYVQGKGILYQGSLYIGTAQYEIAKKKCGYEVAFEYGIIRNLTNPCTTVQKHAQTSTATVTLFSVVQCLGVLIGVSVCVCVCACVCV